LLFVIPAKKESLNPSVSLSLRRDLRAFYGREKMLDLRLSENFGAIISTGSFVGFPPEKRFY
jgi:hypothetical protein